MLTVSHLMSRTVVTVAPHTPLRQALTLLAEHRISGAERYAKVYNIDYNRCIFCGYCVEACPTDAITHGHGFELATYDINALIYRKERLLESWPPSKAANA